MFSLARPVLSAALATTACVAVTLAALPAAADATTAPAGCVSDADYAQLAVGQRLAYVRQVAGDDAQISRRYWASGSNRYQERLYAMCTPRDQNHDALTARFLYYQGAWRAEVIDTRVGPEC